MILQGVGNVAYKYDKKIFKCRGKQKMTENAIRKG